MSKSSASKFDAAALLKKLKTISRKAVHTRVDEDGVPHGSERGVILRVPECDRDGRLKDPRGSVVEVRLPLGTPFSLSAIGDHSHGAELARDAAVAIAGQAAKKKKKGGQPVGQESQASDDVVGCGTAPRFKGKRARGRGASSSDVCFGEGDADNRGRRAELRTKKKHEKRHEGGTSNQDQSSAKSWFDSTPYDPEKGWSGTYTAFDNVPLVSELALKHGFSPFAQNVLTGGMRYEGDYDIRNAAILAVHAANGMFSMACKERELKRKMETFRLLEVSYSELKGELESLNQRLAVVTRNAEEHQLLWESEKARLESELGVVRQELVDAAAEHVAALEQARVSAVDTYLSSEDHSRSMHEMKQQNIREHLASEEYNAVLRKREKQAYQKGQAFNVRFYDYLNAVDYAKIEQGFNDPGVMAGFSLDPFAVDLPDTESDEAEGEDTDKE